MQCGWHDLRWEEDVAKEACGYGYECGYGVALFGEDEDACADHAEAEECSDAQRQNNQGS